MATIEMRISMTWRPLNDLARAIIILSNVIPRFGTVARPRSLVASRTKQPTVGSLAISSQHTFTVVGPCMFCSACQKVAPSDSVGLRAFLLSACTPERSLAFAFFSGRTRPARIPVGRSIRVGWQTIHPEHDLMVYKGLYFCRTCGYYALKRALRLVEPCTSRGRHAKLRALSLLQGNLPPGVASWPNDAIPLARP